MNIGTLASQKLCMCVNFFNGINFLIKITGNSLTH